jgi:hypothetical protein
VWRPEIITTGRLYLLHLLLTPSLFVYWSVCLSVCLCSALVCSALQVTGNPRFGPATAAKVRALLSLLDALGLRADALATAAEERQQTRQKQENKQEEEGEGEGEEGAAAAARIRQQRIYTQHPAPPTMVPLDVFRPDLHQHQHQHHSSSAPSSSSSSVSGGGQEGGEQQSEEAVLLREKAALLRSRKRSQAELEAQARRQVSYTTTERISPITYHPPPVGPPPSPPSPHTDRQTERPFPFPILSSCWALSALLFP